MTAIRKSTIRQWNDSEVMEHFYDLWLTWRFSDESDDGLQRRLTVALAEMRVRGLWDTGRAQEGF